MKRWQKIQEFKCGKDGVYRLSVKGDKLIVEQEIETDLDITSSCRIVYRESKNSDGNYIALTHGKNDVAIFGMGNAPIVMSGYVLQKPENARVSFRVFKLSSWC